MRPNTPDSPNRISLVIVDDHQMFRQGVKLNLELQEDIRVVAECSNGEQALEAVREFKPDVAIIDINLPIINGIQVTRQLSSEHLPTKYVMLTAYDDVQQIIHAIRAGASAYCAKEILPDKLVEVIRHVYRGRYVVHDQIFDAEGIQAWIESGVEAVAGQYYADMAESFSPLSGREMEILQYVTNGLSNKEIARTLKISHQTVKNHMTSILRKLAVEDRTQAAVFALRRGWVRLSDTGSPRDKEEA